jgi:hypothetical protein
VTPEQMVAFVQKVLDEIEMPPAALVEEAQADVPEGWKVEAVKQFELREFADVHEKVPHVTGLIAERSCGCAVTLGQRLDRHEATTGIYACSDEHEQTCILVLNALQTMPPQDEPVLPLAARMIEENL